MIWKPVKDFKWEHNKWYWIKRPNGTKELARAIVDDAINRCTLCWGNSYIEHEGQWSYPSMISNYEVISAELDHTIELMKKVITLATYKDGDDWSQDALDERMTEIKELLIE